MSIKPSMKLLQSGELNSPAAVVSGANLALGNLASNVSNVTNMLPSTTSFNNLINSPLTLSGGGGAGAIGGSISETLGGVSNVGDLKTLVGGSIGNIGGAIGGGLGAVGGGIGGALNNIPSLGSIIGNINSVPNIGNGMLNNASSITGSIGGALSGAVTGSIDSIGGTITNNVNAISGAISGLSQNISDTVAGFSEVASAVAAGDIGALVSNVLPSLSFNTKPSTEWGLCYPETLKNVALNPAHIHFQFYNQNTKQKLTSIHLPMPDEIQNPSTINWEATDFGMMGNAAVKAIKSVKSDNVNKADIKSELNSMAERVKSVAFYHAAAEVVNGLGGNQLSPDDIMGASSGKVTNPYKTFLFRGVNFRTFNFKFSLVPFSESDCNLIDRIVTKFREHSYPDFAGEKMFFTYPDECQITYMWESDTNKWLNNFKRAVCSGINVNFAPLGQWASLRNGFPYMIELQTTWTEVEIITKGDISTKNSLGQRS